MEHTQERTMQVLKDLGVILSGHFLLTSGRHSDTYMQCAKLFEHPRESAELCGLLAESFRDAKIDLVAGPALGGIIICYETARALGVRNIFAERDSGVMTFRRGFRVNEGERVLVVEDVVTTGGSSMEVIKLVQDAGGVVVGVGSVVDRSNGRVDFGVPFHPLMSADVKSWEADGCPLCKQGTPAVKPGSRTAAK